MFWNNFHIRNSVARWIACLITFIYSNAASAASLQKWTVILMMVLGYSPLKSRFTKMNHAIRIAEWRLTYVGIIIRKRCYMNRDLWILWKYPKARYTLFVTVHEQWRNHFFVKKIKFREKWQKWVYTLFVIDLCFRERVVESKIWRKNFFDFVKKLPTAANEFRKTLMNMTNYSLHTIRGSHRFRPFVPFSSLFANSV